MAKVEPYQTGTYKFWCDCGWEDIRFGCTRIVNDSEPNFSCERPIVEATDQKCKLRWQLAPLVETYKTLKAAEDAQAYLAEMEVKKAEALKTLGLTEAQYNAAKSPPVSTVSQPVEEA